MLRLLHPDKQRESGVRAQEAGIRAQAMSAALVVLGDVKGVFECCFTVGLWATNRVSYEEDNHVTVVSYEEDSHVSHEEV